MTDLPAAAITPELISAVAADVACTCGQGADGYYLTHARRCPRSVSPSALTAILVAAAPHLAAADPTTETEGFRAYKAGLNAGRAESAATEIERLRPQLEAAITRQLDPLFAAIGELLIVIADECPLTDRVVAAADKLQLAMVPLGLRDTGPPPTDPLPSATTTPQERP